MVGRSPVEGSPVTDAKRIAKLEAQVAALRARLSARTDQLLLVLLQIDDLKKLTPAEVPVHPAQKDSTC